MALAALSIYHKAIAARSAELRAEILADGPRALDPGLLTELRTVAESMTANHPAPPAGALAQSRRHPPAVGPQARRNSLIASPPCWPGHDDTH